MGNRLTDALAGRGVLARLGGDEFAALLPGCSDAVLAAGLALAMQDSLGPFFSIGGRSFNVGAGAGGAGQSYRGQELAGQR